MNSKQLFTVKYLKLFVNGVLVGLNFEETLTGSIETCNAIFELYNNETIVKAWFGGSDYKIVECEMVYATVVI